MVTARVHFGRRALVDLLGLEKGSLGELAALAHPGWVIERFHEEGKMELGLYHFEGRRWRGLNHHLLIPAEIALHSSRRNVP